MKVCYFRIETFKESSQHSHNSGLIKQSRNLGSFVCLHAFLISGKISFLLVHFCFVPLLWLPCNWYGFCFCVDSTVCHVCYA